MHFIIMGITKSNQNHNHYEDVYEHPRLGQILRIQYSETSEQEIGYTVPVESMAALEKWEKMVALFKNTICS